jgi:hypothetical protein
MEGGAMFFSQHASLIYSISFNFVINSTKVTFILLYCLCYEHAQRIETLFVDYMR